MICDYRWLKVYNVMPVAGGKLDQDPKFIDAVEVLDQEKVKLDGENGKQ